MAIYFADLFDGLICISDFQLLYQHGKNPAYDETRAFVAQFPGKTYEVFT